MIILPLDHALTQGILIGLENPLDLLNSLDKSFLNATVLNKGWIMKDESFKVFKDLPFFIHLSASTTLSISNETVLTTTIPEAIKLGADGVSIHINFDNMENNLLLRKIGYIVKEANEYSLPVLAMLYTQKLTEEKILHMARIGEELGVDYIKLPYYNKDNFIKKLSLLIQTPLLIAGGEVENDFIVFLEKAYKSIEDGAFGIIAGRNIFQRNDPNYCLQLLYKILNKDININNIESTDSRLNLRNKILL